MNGMTAVNTLSCARVMHFPSALRFWMCLQPGGCTLVSSVACLTTIWVYSTYRMRVLVFIIVGVPHSSATCVLEVIELNNIQPVFVQGSVSSDVCDFLISVDSHHAHCSCHWYYDKDLESYVQEQNVSHISLQPLGPYFSHDNITCYYVQAIGAHCANFIFAIKDLYPGKHDM